MGYMIEISESKKEKLSEHIEKALHEMGKAMALCEQFGSMSERYGERGGQGGGSYGNRYDDMGMRGSYGSRGGDMGYREEDDDDEMMWGERRGVRGSGRGRR